MIVDSVKTRCTPNFGVVKYNKAGLARLNDKLGSNAQNFINSQSANHTADIFLLGDKVKVLYNKRAYEIPNYRNTNFNRLIFEEDSHFTVSDGSNHSFEVLPMDYPLYLQHLWDELIAVPFTLDKKRGLFVTNTKNGMGVNYGRDNIEYANAHEMASHLEKFQIAGINAKERMLLEDNSWAEAYKKIIENKHS